MLNETNINIRLGPDVQMVGSVQFHPHIDFDIPDCDSDPVALGAFAAKGCYDSFGKDGRDCYENQKAILQYMHGSVLEHMNVSLFITGITRALTLEMNRHRHFAISQRSTRYTAEEDAAIVLEPYYADLYRKCDEGSATDIELDILQRFIDACERSFLAYGYQVEKLLEQAPDRLKGFEKRKWARGKARNVLPHALETRVTYTGNMRAWRWFIECRSSRHAEPEIRRVAFAVWEKLLNTSYRFYVEDFAWDEEVDGIPELHPMYNKV